MNHYPRHIGDWRVATSKLTRIQRDIYAELIDTYYDKELPLPADIDELAEDQACRTVEERDALAYILRRFFKRDGGVYRHERCEEEIAAFHHLVHVRSTAGKASGSARALRRMNTGGTHVEQTSNTGPAESNNRATTQYPIPNTHPVLTNRGESGDPTAQPETPTATPAPPAPTAEPKINRPSRKAPKSFVVDPAMAQWAATECPLLTVDDIDRETAKFRDHTFGRAISDWIGAWRNWLRKEHEFRATRRPPAPPRPPDRRAKVDNFRQAVMGNQNAGGQGSIDVESRVVRDGEESPPGPHD